MLNKKSIEFIGLSDEQLERYKELERREDFLRDTLIRCGVHHAFRDRIIKCTDLTKIDTNNIDELEEAIKNEWSEGIIKGE